jgi:hypothetical protein
VFGIRMHSSPSRVFDERIELASAGRRVEKSTTDAADVCVAIDAGPAYVWHVCGVTMTSCS